jgi:rhodanese-related sulfurtransferase
MKSFISIVVIYFLLLITCGVFAQNTKPASVSFEAFEAKLKQASPNPQILDARTNEEFGLDHLQGAVQVNVSNDVDILTVASKLDKKKPVFVYSINNGRSGVLAKKLRDQNFSEVYELPGGISKWIGAGNPVVSTVGSGLSYAEYEKLIASNKLVLVDIHSKFCGGCKKLLPTVDSVARENSNTLKVVKIELFDNKKLGKDLNIESIPTLLLYNGNKIVWRQSGVTAKATLDQVIKAQLQ